MIIVKLTGGLGNQMFQYSIGRHLAHKNKTKLKLDISGFKAYKLWKYELGNFNIIEEFATEAEIRKFNLKRMFNIFFKEKNILHREKEGFRFDSDVLKCKENVYLKGYWQSEDYFKNIESIIRKDFTVKNLQIGQNKEMAKQISLCKSSISLHVRRGDYISSSDANRFHGTCTLDYYKHCVKYFIQKVTNPCFFIFSDDFKWVRNNLKLFYPTVFVDHNGPDSGYEDLRLMSQCKYNIIANSSFSWWGAWLNNYENRIVLAPEKWLKADIKTPDLLPNDWVRI